MSNQINIKGRRFNHLTVLSEVSTDSHREDGTILEYFGKFAVLNFPDQENAYG